MKNSFSVCLLFATCSLHGADLNVGVGRRVITPEQQPVWLAGYAARTTPSTGMIHHVWAKALVFEEPPSNRVAFITVDVLGLSREIVQTVTSRLQTRYGFERSQVFVNSSHTHSAPPVWPCLSICYSFTQQEKQAVAAFNVRLTDALLGAVETAMTNLAPARVASGCGSAGFAVNRRKFDVKPVDHDVPVVRVTAPDGGVRAVLFGYACHNTTLTGNNLLLNGDYAGFAQIELEKVCPGATALFLQGCAADQNPSPRGTVELAQQYGRELAGAVQRVLSGEMRPVRAPLRTCFLETRLDFRPLDLEQHRHDFMGADVFKQRRAEFVLSAYNKGNPITSIPYPVQAVRFGDDLSVLALSGEVVVDYSRRAKREYAAENLIVAGYCNEVQCYIPSARVLREGGYEANESMIYYGLPGPFAEHVEESVFGAVRQVMKRVGVESATGE